MAEVIFAIPLAAAKRVEPFLSKDGFRYYLNGFSVEPADTGVVLAATDGHCLGALAVSDAFAARKVICVPAKWGALRLPTVAIKTKKSIWLVCKDFGDSLILMIAVAAESLQQAIETPASLAMAVYKNPLIDGTFPDWRRAVPTEVAPVSAPFSPAVVARFSRDRAAVRFSGSEEGASLVRLSGDDDFIGVVMSLRNIAGDFSRPPAWALPAPSQATDTPKEQA